MKLVNPANKRKYDVIVVGSGLAGASAAASLARAGYNVKCFCFQDSPRRAHSIAAQGGINAAKNYQNDGDSVYRLFYDTIKGGDFRAREANVYRLAEVSASTSSTSASRRACRSRASTAACSPTAPSAARRSRARSTRAARPASSSCSAPTQALERQIGAGQGQDVPAHRDARPRRRRRPGARHRRRATWSPARSSRTRPTRSCWRPAATATSSTSRPTRRAATSPRSGARYKKRRALREPLLHADPPDLHPGHRRLPVEAHADVRVAAQRRPRLGAAEEGRHARRPTRSPRPSATTTSSASTRASATSRRATSPRAPPRKSATRAAASARAGCGVYLDFARRDQAARRARRSRERYGNLFDMYEHITGEDPYKVPMRIYPAVTTRWAGCGWTTT